MPYIREEAAVRIDEGGVPLSQGELNYAITCLLVRYVDAHGLEYARINDVQGALKNASAEFDARITRPYEAAARKRPHARDPYTVLVRELP